MEEAFLEGKWISSCSDCPHREVMCVLQDIAVTKERVRIERMEGDVVRDIYPARLRLDYCGQTGALILRSRAKTVPGGICGTELIIPTTCPLKKRRDDPEDK